MLQTINILGDQDPMNDQHTYGLLIKTFLAVGDKVDATAALVVIMKASGIAPPSHCIQGIGRHQLQALVGMRWPVQHSVHALQEARVPRDLFLPGLP